MTQTGRGIVSRITEDTEFVRNPPFHEGAVSYGLLTPKNCPEVPLKLFISEISNVGGRVLPDVHVNEDHVFYVLSGRAIVTVGAEEFRLQPGDCLYIPANTTHSLVPIGGENYRAVVLLVPSKGSRPVGTHTVLSPTAELEAK